MGYILLCKYFEINNDIYKWSDCFFSNFFIFLLTTVQILLNNIFIFSVEERRKYCRSLSPPEDKFFIRTEESSIFDEMLFSLPGWCGVAAHCLVIIVINLHFNSSPPPCNLTMCGAFLNYESMNS